jgi:hypothetical protein
MFILYSTINYLYHTSFDILLFTEKLKLLNVTFNVNFYILNKTKSELLPRII